MEVQRDSQEKQAAFQRQNHSDSQEKGLFGPRRHRNLGKALIISFEENSQNSKQPSETPNKRKNKRESIDPSRPAVPQER